MYVVTHSVTGQWLTEPIPEPDARSIARLTGNNVQEVDV